jgi:hypothetical protein
MEEAVSQFDRDFKIGEKHGEAGIDDPPKGSGFFGDRTPAEQARKDAYDAGRKVGKRKKDGPGWW